MWKSLGAGGDHSCRWRSLGASGDHRCRWRSLGASGDHLVPVEITRCRWRSLSARSGLHSRYCEIVHLQRCKGCCQCTTSLITRCPSMTRFEVWTPFCHTLITHHLSPPWNFDNLMNLSRRNMPSMQTMNYNMDLLFQPLFWSSYRLYLTADILSVVWCSANWHSYQLTLLRTSTTP